VPAVDVADTGKEIIVHVELPGMDAKDIDTSVNGRVLTIKGEKKRDEELERKSYHRLERRYGSFIRSFELPADIDTDKMRASYENGVLSLHLPKAKVRPVKRIEVKRR
jgi:HSP20 family protein